MFAHFIQDLFQTKALPFVGWEVPVIAVAVAVIVGVPTVYYCFCIVLYEILGRLFGSRGEDFTNTLATPLTLALDLFRWLQNKLSFRNRWLLEDEVSGLKDLGCETPASRKANQDKINARATSLALITRSQCNTQVSLQKSGDRARLEEANKQVDKAKDNYHRLAQLARSCEYSVEAWQTLAPDDSEKSGFRFSTT